MTTFIIVGILAVVVLAVLFYRNNQKKIDQAASKVSADAKTVVNTVKKVATDVKSGGK